MDVKNTMNKVYIVHGYTASPMSNWFPWLKSELENRGVDVVVLSMPDSNKPRKEKWLDYLESNMPDLNDSTIVIGHSLGCVAILLYLQRKRQSIKGGVLVSGFVDESPIFELSSFMDEHLDYKLLQTLIPKRVAVTAKDDDIVPYKYTEIMANKLDAAFILLDSGKHFIDRDGCYELPIVLDEISKMN
jgi:predicted alpha/beta hydrolase family esterase